MKHVSPLDQALGCLKQDTHKHILVQNLEPLNTQSREDLCLAIVAYVRFGMKRPFANPLMQVIFQSFIELL